MFTKSSFNECEALMASRVKQVRTNACGAFARKKIHKASKEYHIEYKEFYSNHIAHLLVAMDGLGATHDQMQKEYVSYALRAYPGALEPFVDPEDCVVTAENWEEHLGSNKFGSGREFDKRWYSAYRDFFKKECHDKGRKETIARYFPRLIRGFAGAAFHALIQFGWGLSIDDDQMIIDGFAYLCYSYWEMGEYSEDPPVLTRQPLDILSDIKFDRDLQLTREKGFQTTLSSLSEKQRNLLLSYASQWVFPEHHSPEDVYEDLGVLVTRLYYFSNCRDFFVLHGVTAAYGVKHILAALGDDPLKYEFLRCPPLDRSDDDKYNLHEEGSLHWDDLARRALAQSDVHKTKVIFAMSHFSDWWPSYEDFWFKVAEETLRVENWSYDGINEGCGDMQGETE